LRTRSCALAKTDTINAMVTAANGATFLDPPASPLQPSAFVDPLADLPSLRAVTRGPSVFPRVSHESAGIGAVDWEVALLSFAARCRDARLVGGPSI